MISQAALRPQRVRRTVVVIEMDPITDPLPPRSARPSGSANAAQP
jgi:hypothetical protein